MTTPSSNYMYWDSIQFVKWIISISPVYRNKYERILTKSFREHNITGQCIFDLDMSDLKEYGIINLSDREKIYVAIQQLISTQKRFNSLGSNETEDPELSIALALSEANNMDVEEDRLLLNALNISMEEDSIDNVSNIQITESKNKQDLDNDQKQSANVTSETINLAKVHILICLSSIKLVDRKRDSNLIQKVMQKIISNPTNAKYGNVNITRLSAKLSNYGPWSGFLIKCGFHTSQDGSRLMFDYGMIDRLKIFHQMIMNYDIESVPVKQNRPDSSPIQTMQGLHDAVLFLCINNKKTSIMQLQCVCGKALQSINIPHTLYDGRGAFCNVCITRGAINQRYHHCADSKNKKHPRGFDICDNCSRMLIESMEKVWSLMSGKCNRSAAKCLFFFRLMILMQKCMNTEDENIDMTHDYLHISENEMIQYYLHILENHNDCISYNVMHDVIVDVLGECKLSQCSYFASLYEINSDRNSKCSAYTSLKQKLWNRIHCFFYHGFDIGLRLRVRDINKLKTSGHGSECKDDEINIYWKVRKLLENKRIAFQKELNPFKTRLSARFSQFQLSGDENKQNDDHNHCKVFHFGIMFEYEDVPDDVLSNHTHVRVHHKYSSLKEELIQNKIVRLNVQQYDDQYQQAAIHLNSFFCKKHYSQPFIPSDNNWHVVAMGSMALHESVSFGINHILSLMVYCNYDTLQYEFSKTYRENNGKNHTYFYFLGKNIKFAVKMFGQKIKNGPVEKFYHGIGEKLRIQHLNKTHSGGACIRCPLSTSSSFAVATNFTVDSNGMIVEFSSSTLGEHTKSFDCSWLSKYSNEKEHLFIQNSFMEKLKISNICSMSGRITEYDDIMKAMDIMRATICSKVMILNIANDDDVQSELIKTLLIHILHDRLSAISGEYSKFNSLDNYARNMISECFDSQQTITIYPALLVGSNDLMKKRLRFLYHIFVDNECVKLDHVFAIFPNAILITIEDVPLCETFMNRLFQYLTDDFVKTKLHILRITPSQIGWKVSKTINEYKSAFDGIGYKLNEIKNNMCHAMGKAPVELEVAHPSCKYNVSRTCTGAGSIDLTL